MITCLEGTFDIGTLGEARNIQEPVLMPASNTFVMGQQVADNLLVVIVTYRDNANRKRAGGVYHEVSLMHKHLIIVLKYPLNTY